MAVRDIYTEAEKKMITETNRNMDENLVGWARFADPVATELDLKVRANAWDPWNPLWRDDDYALGTRWGRIIAFPLFEDKYGPGTMKFIATPECGFQSYTYFGDDYVFHRPVHVGDSFKVWCRRPEFIDVTPLDGNGPRTFHALSMDCDKINQNDELVSTLKKYSGRMFYPKQPKPPSTFTDYAYTEAEIQYLENAVREEEIRGAKIRYWEDVNIGDQLNRVVGGPISLDDMRQNGRIPTVPKTIPRRVSPDAPQGSLKLTNNRDGLQVFAQGPWDFLRDDDTGLLSPTDFQHYADRPSVAIGLPKAFLYAVQARHTMVRLITNWMGDDGFIRKFKWRHMSRSWICDAWIGNGKVVNKRIENDEHLIDLKIWLENIRGYTSEAAVAIVSLISSQGEPYKWK